MKRIFSLILIAAMLLITTPVPGASDNELNSAIFEVTSLGIFEGDENGNLNIEDTMTRAEFAKLAVILSGVKDVAGSGVSPAYDVPSGHWASGYIRYLMDAKLMTGYEDGSFRPEATITLEECVKTILVVMGYKVAAESRGGFPDGYLSIAVEKHMLDNVKAARNEPALRKDIILVIYNALDVPNMTSNYSVKESYGIDYTLTLRSLIVKLEDLDEVTGIVTANSDIWLNAPNSNMETGQIEIDNLLYSVSSNLIDRAASYIGQEVTAFYKYDSTMPCPVIFNIQPTTVNKVQEIRSEEALSFTSSEISCEDGENGKKRKIGLGGETRFVYNGRPEVRLTEEFRNIECGSYIIIDNDYDSTPEYVFAYEYDNYVIEKVNANGNLKLKYIGEVDGDTELLRKSILLDFDKENSFVIRNTEEETLSFDALKEGDVISVYENNEDDFIKIVVGKKEPFTAKISEKDSEYLTLYTDDEIYNVSSSALYNKADIGEYYIFSTDAYGRIAYIEETTEDGVWKYGYIFRTNKRGLGGTEVLMIDAGQVINRAEQNLEDRTDTSTIPVTLCQNSAATILPVSQKVSVDGKNIQGEDIAVALGKAIRYALNSDGALRRIEYLEEIGGSIATKYNAKEKVFGTVNVLEQRPFMINADTKVICVPEDSEADSEDILVQISIDNKDTLIQYNAFGYECDEETNAAKLLVITQDMKASDIKAVVPSQAKTALVRSAKHSFDEEGNEYLKVELATGSELRTMDTLPLDERAVFENLRKGDIIFYSETADGKLDNIKIVNNVRSAVKGEEGTLATDYSQDIGYVEDIRMNRIDNVNRIRINQIDLITLDGLRIINVPISNYPDVFIYDLESETVSTGSIDDIVPYPVPVENPQKIVVLYSGTTIRSIIIIK